MIRFAPRGGVKSSHSKGLQAFTVAEVLITLGIIGVVAALTLPTLISNYQKRVYVTQLKKSVSVLSNGFKLMMAHDGVTELKDTEAIAGLPNICYPDHPQYCDGIRKGLESVFSGIQFTPCDGSEIKNLGGSIIGSGKSTNNTCIEFPDGFEIYSYSFVPPANAPANDFFVYLSVDVNGPKNPNTTGRDIFDLVIDNNGVVYGVGSRPYSEIRNPSNPDSEYWRTTTFSLYKCDTSSWGFTCAGRVLEEDAMNY